MSSRAFVETTLTEGGTAVLTATIQDENGDGFKPATVTLTLYDLRSGSIINSRDRQSILDVNGGTVTAGGALSLELGPADMAMVGSAAGREEHVAMIEWSWDSATKADRHEIHFFVDNVNKVPAP